MTQIFSGTDEAWDKRLSPYNFSGVFLQSSRWRAVHAARGNATMQIIDSAGAPSLWVLLPIRYGVRVWYCAKGPAEMPRGDEWKKIRALLQSRRHATIMRIEPPHPSDALLGGTCAFHRRRDISPSHTLRTDIARTDEQLMQSFHEKTRYNIRLAERHGVVVRIISVDEATRRRTEILSLYAQTGARHEISHVPARDFAALFPHADVWVAEHEKKIIATALLIGFGTTMTYVHGASAYEDRALMAPHALHWSAMRAARAKNFIVYDWWGIAPEGEPTHGLAGVTRFKLGFGGVRVSAPGTFDAGIDRVRFALYTFATRHKRHIHTRS